MKRDSKILDYKRRSKEKFGVKRFI